MFKAWIMIVFLLRFKSIHPIPGWSKWEENPPWVNECDHWWVLSHKSWFPLLLLLVEGESFLYSPWGPSMLACSLTSQNAFESHLIFKWPAGWMTARVVECSNGSVPSWPGRPNYHLHPHWPEIDHFSKELSSLSSPWGWNWKNITFLSWAEFSW